MSPRPGYTSFSKRPSGRANEEPKVCVCGLARVFAYSLPKRRGIGLRLRHASPGCKETGLANGETKEYLRDLSRGFVYEDPRHLGIRVRLRGALLD